jgi:PAS domain S-box-containing protein/putative nucleotidyltransferase with HDIG domain
VDIKHRRQIQIARILGRSGIDSILLSFFHATHPDYCFVGVFDADTTHIETISLLEGHKKAANIYYPLNDSPCSLIRSNQTRIYKKYANKYCSADLYLQYWGIHGFIGYPIIDDERNVLGVLAAFYKNPITDTASITQQMKERNDQLAIELEKEIQKRSLGVRGKRFEDLLRNSRDIILIINKMGKVIYRAPSNYAILGLTDQEAVGLNIQTLVHPDDLPQVQKKIKAVGRKPGLSANFQIRALHSNGEYKWIDGTVMNHTNEPTIRGLVVNYHDITEKKTADEEIASNERRFRTLIERSHDCISLIDADNKCQYFSPSVTKILGYKPEELLGMDARSLSHPEDMEEIYRSSKATSLLPNMSVTYQARMLAKDGNWKWIEAIATNLLEDPDIQAIVVNFKDISDRKQTEDKLKVSERSFREFLETVNLAAVILDAEGRVEFINDFSLSLTGYTRPELIGSSFFDRFLDPEDKFIDAFKSGIHTGMIPHQFESVIKTSTGSDRLIAWNNTVLRGVSGDVTGIACLGEDITVFRKNEERAKLQVQRVSALHSIDVVISSSFDARIVFSVIVDQIMKQMGVDAVKVMTYNPVEKKLTCVVDRGFDFPEQKIMEMNLDESHSARAILERQTTCYPDGEHHEEINPRIFSQEGFIVGYSTPMTIKGQVKGVVEVYNRSPLEPDAGWMEFYETLAGQAAIAIENDEMFERLERALADLTSAYDSTLEGWVRALDLRDKETIGHTQRVAMLVVGFALELGVSGDDLVNIRRGALLHDIGKMGIPDEILNKAGPLTDDERLVIQRHPQYAYELLRPIHYLGEALDIPYAHHERWDGKGYPRGLKGEEIPLSARIFSVVDVWDALGSTRTYRMKWDQDKMIAYLKEQSGKKFDPSIVKVFIDLVERKLI